MTRRVFISFHRTLAAIAWAACAAAMVGCHSDIVPVSGRVTFNGKPLPGADVIFQPLGNSTAPRPAGTGSIGHTDDEGRFSLRMVEPNRPGAVVGDHIVRIAVNSDESATTPAKGSPLPLVWRDGSRQFRVPPSGTTKADFNITTGDPPPAKAKSRRAR